MGVCEEEKTYLLESDKTVPKRFTGKPMAFATSKTYDRSGMEESARWTELRLYITKGGNYICQTQGMSEYGGEVTRRKVAVCESVLEVIEHFGQGRLAKEIYKEAGIENVDDVD